MKLPNFTIQLSSSYSVRHLRAVAPLSHMLACKSGNFHAPNFYSMPCSGTRQLGHVLIFEFSIMKIPSYVWCCGGTHNETWTRVMESSHPQKQQVEKSWLRSHGNRVISLMWFVSFSVAFIIDSTAMLFDIHPNDVRLIRVLTCDTV